MLEIYTPESWFSIFRGSPKLIIDDGYIYHPDGYYSLIKNPVGKIDEMGRIYGQDYSSICSLPIGYIKDEGDGIRRIYDKDPDLFLMKPEPIFYIVEEKIYSSDEYNSISIKNPSGYIKTDAKGDTEIPKVSSEKNQSPSSEQGNTVSDGSLGFGLLVGICLLFFICGFFWWFSGAVSIEFILFTINEQIQELTKAVRQM